MAALAIVAAMVAGSVVGTVGAAEHQRIDATFVTAANTACRSAFASSMTPGPPGRDAQSVRRSADQVDQLATQLANLPIGSWSRPLINEWLFHWHRYADNRRLFAARLGPGSSSNGADSSGPSGAAAAESGAATEAAIADRFAQTSGLTACTLAANRV